MRNTTKREIILDLIKRMPNTAVRVMARRLCEENPMLFKDAEDARGHLKYYLGLKGEVNRKLAHKHADCFRKPDAAANNEKYKIDSPPKPRAMFDADWDLVDTGLTGRVLVLQDIHIPFHDINALMVAAKYAKKQKVEHIVLNGDAADFYSVSNWERRPDMKFVRKEIEDVRHFLKWLRHEFPKAEILWKDGNHEERWWRMLDVRAPELFGMEEFKMSTLLHFAEHRIRYVGEMRPLRLGKLYLIHGHEYRFPISNPVNPARGLFLRAKTLAACGHFHQSSQHSERNLEQKVVSCWSFGCLCDLHPPYRPLNNWNHGFGLVQVESDGTFDVESKRIIDGQVY